MAVVDMHLLSVTMNVDILGVTAIEHHWYLPRNYMEQSAHQVLESVSWQSGLIFWDIDEPRLVIWFRYQESCESHPRWFCIQFPVQIWLHLFFMTMPSDKDMACMKKAICQELSWFVQWLHKLNKPTIILEKHLQPTLFVFVIDNPANVWANIFQAITGWISWNPW